uniref:C-type lectin domain-containing protein n=1 Tax=Labrus bergylta TaxID=56723 RepID=A0A3Q3L6U4_9LABR
LLFVGRQCLSFCICWGLLCPGPWWVARTPSERRRSETPCNHEEKTQFFSSKMTWIEAQAYCREHHTDLSFVGSEREQKMLQTAAGERFLLGWIGLHKDAVKRSVWKWSGGGDSTYFNWAPNQPDDYRGIETVVNLRVDGKWNDKCLAKKDVFFLLLKNIRKLNLN